MAKKFMFVCFGILALVVAFHLGAQYGQAGYVYHSTTGVIALHDWDNVLLDNGEVWQLDSSTGEWELTGSALPVPVSQIKQWELLALVTTSNELWRYSGANWVNYGSPPTGPTATQSATWSEIKAEFGK